MDAESNSNLLSVSILDGGATVQAKEAGERQSAEDIVNDIVSNIDNNQEGQNIDNTGASGYNNEKWQHVLCVLPFFSY